MYNASLPVNSSTILVGETKQQKPTSPVAENF